MPACGIFEKSTYICITKTIKIMTKKIDTLADLTPDGENFNKHTEFGQKLLEESLRKFGAGRSILVDKDGNIIAGNSTTETAAAIGMDDVIVVPTDGKKLVVVQRTDLSLDSPEGRELALADNMTALKGIDIDLAKVQETLGDDLAKAWGMDIPEVQKQAQEDDFDPDKPVETVCKKDDIWKLGNHRLMCGDSTDAGSVALLMDGEKADLWLTDPPYNVDYAEKEQYKKDLGYAVSKHEVAIANDKMANDEFLQFLTNAFTAAQEFLKKGGVFYIWHADTEGYNFRKALMDCGDMKIAETLIWVKDRLCFGRQDYHWQHEPCLYGWKDGAGHKWYSDRSQTTTLNFQKPQKSELHPTMKPVELIAYEIKNSSAENDIILDTFGGSGTTLIAAEQLNRKCYMMELEPHYCDVIIARWEKLTNKKAERISNGND